MEKRRKITGTFIWYYHICKREVWLMGHELNPYQQDDFLVLGRFLSEESYKREKKETRIDNISIDLIKKEEEHLLVGEIKKSSRYIEAARMQLSYYLQLLYEKGVEAKGVILIPQERKRIEVVLTPDLRERLEKVKKEIMELIEAPFPPPPVKIHWCKNCAYKEFCFS